MTASKVKEVLRVSRGESSDVPSGWWILTFGVKVFQDG